MGQLTDKIAIVTGGAQGLGASICQRLAREGAHVVVADLKIEQAEQLAQSLAQESGRRTLALAVNVTVEEQVQAMVDRTVAEFGRLDILVANAGILLSGPVEEMEVDNWQRVIDVNLTGYFLASSMPRA